MYNTILKIVLQSLSKIVLQSLSAAFLTSTERKHALQRVFSASANGRRPVDVRNAADNDCNADFNSDSKTVFNNALMKTSHTYLLTDSLIGLPTYLPTD